MDRPRIFVSIANYRDPEIVPTLRSLFENARYPERIVAGVLSQVDTKEDADCIPYSDPRIRQFVVDYRDSPGLSWARNFIFSHLLSSEEFILQIDSHSRFTPGWDEIALDNWRLCNDPQAYVSHYPPGYTKETGNAALIFHQQIFKSFDNDDLPKVITKVLNDPDAPAQLQRSPLFAGGCYFAPSSAVRTVPYDPLIYFNGEEITQAVRLYTHGFNGFTPKRSFMWHLYRKPADNYRRMHWEDHAGFTEQQKLAKERVQHLLRIKFSSNSVALKDLNKYGLGDVRSLHDYERFAGISLRNKQLSERALQGNFND